MVEFDVLSIVQGLIEAVIAAVDPDTEKKKQLVQSKLQDTKRESS